MCDHNKKEEKLCQLLNQLEDELRLQNLWQDEEPSEQALTSSLPFSMGTLTFEQWLQFVFIVKMRWLLQLRKALPEAISVSPFAVEYYKNVTIKRSQIIALLTRIDLLLTRSV